MIVEVFAVEATTLALSLLVVSSVDGTSIRDAINPAANVVDAIISDDDFIVSSVSKKRIDDVVLTTAQVAVDLVTLADTAVLVKDADETIIGKTLEI